MPAKCSLHAHLISSLNELHNVLHVCVAHQSSQTSAYLVHGNNSAGVGIGGALLSDSFYMCVVVECILSSESLCS